MYLTRKYTEVYAQINNISFVKAVITTINAKVMHTELIGGLVAHSFVSYELQR